jgi:hypothetical protein
MNNAGLTQKPRLDAWEQIYAVLFRPTEAFSAPVKPGTLPLGLAVLLLVSVMLALIHAGTLVSLWLMIVMIGCWLVLLWCLGSGILYLLTRGVAADATLGQLLGATALSALPWCLLAPLHALAARGGWGPSLAAVGTLVVWVWWLKALHGAIAGTLGITGKQATLAIFGSVITLLALPLLLGIVGVLTVVIVAL